MKHQPPMLKLDGSGWKMSRIPVIEIFGPTIQGEGAVIGLKTMFVRTAGCDYSCSWCDSSFTWDGTGKMKSNKWMPWKSGMNSYDWWPFILICHDFWRESGFN